MLSNLKSKLEAQRLRELYESSKMFISGGASAANQHSSRLELKSEADYEDDDELIEIVDRGGGAATAAAASAASQPARSGTRSTARNYSNSNPDDRKPESINLRSPPARSNHQRVLVDDIGLFSDLEPHPPPPSSRQLLVSNESSGRRSGPHLAAHSHSHHHSNHQRPHQRPKDDDVPMLNPNFESSHEADLVENNHSKMFRSSSMPPANGLAPDASTSSLLDDHCHVSVSLSDKERNRTVWYKLITVFILCVLFMVGEIVGGILAKSISIQTDAAHMAADIAGFFFSILAIYVSEKEPTRRLSFGYYRSEVLGALFSILLIWLLTGVLVYLAIVRVITNDFEIESKAMVITASCGVVFNIIMFIVLHTNRCFGDHLKHHGHSHSGDGHHNHSHTHSAPSVHGHSHSNRLAIPKFTSAPSMPINDNYMPGEEPDQHISAYLDSDSVDIIDRSHGDSCHGHSHDNDERKKDHGNINLRAAAIHVIGDFIQSVGVLIASIIIYFNPEFKLADPICTFIFSVLVILTTAPIIKDIYFVLMEGLPIHLNYNLIAADLCSLNNVKNAHNLHIWCLTMDKFVLAVHLVTERNVDTQQVLRDANNMLRSKYKIERTIIQVEYFVDGMEACPQCRLPK